VDVGQLVELHPRLFHMADQDAWPSIAAHGLLSTEALVDRYELSSDFRSALLDQRRRKSVRIDHPVHGSAVIRDNKPMTDAALERCLTDGTTPREWYRRLNGLVFFWVRPERLGKLLRARAYRSCPHLVLELDSARLIAAHGSEVLLSPINSGSTLYNAPPRGSSTFSTIDAFPYEERRAKRGNSRAAIAELAVRYHVPDALQFVVHASIRHPDGTESPVD
jgi:hypothetical protein